MYKVLKEESLRKDKLTIEKSDNNLEDEIKNSLNMLNELQINTRRTNNFIKQIKNQQMKTFSNLKDVLARTILRKEKLQDDLLTQKQRLNHIKTCKILKQKGDKGNVKQKITIKKQWMSISDMMMSIKEKENILKWLKRENSLCESKLAEMKNKNEETLINFKNSNIQKEVEINKGKLFITDDSKSTENSILPKQRSTIIGNSKSIKRSTNILENNYPSSMETTCRNASIDLVPKLSINEIKRFCRNSNKNSRKILKVISTENLLRILK